MQRYDASTWLVNVTESMENGLCDQSIGLCKIAAPFFYGRMLMRDKGIKTQCFDMIEPCWMMDHFREAFPPNPQRLVTELGLLVSHDALIRPRQQ